MFISGTFNEILLELHKVRTWLNDELGILTEGTRFEEMLSTIQKILNAQQENRVLELYRSEGKEKLIFSLFEAQKYPMIMKAFKGERPNLLKKKDFEEILKGPFLPENEEPGTGSGNPRNKLFELFVAAIMKLAGHSVVGFDDVVVEFEGRKIFIECKRLHSEKHDRIKNNLEKAEGQISKKIYSNDKNKDRGLVALSLDKLLEFDGQIMHYPTGLEGFNQLKLDLINWVNENKNFLWGRVKDRRVLGILVYGNRPAIDDEKKVIISVENFFMIPRPKKQYFKVGDKKFVERLGKKIEEIFE